jgi:hypothetical protein
MLEINLPDVVAEVTAAFRRYEQALVANDVAVLTELFWRSPLTIRYGVAENLKGWEAISAFRQAQPAVDLDRDLIDTVITTNTEYRRKGSGRYGRQSQTWMRTPKGWRVVTAHVSLLPEQ